MHLSPLKAETLTHQCAQVCLVEKASGLRRAIQGRAVQSREASIAPTRQVRGDDVGMQLWVKRTAHPVAVGRRDQPLGALDVLACLTAAHHHGLRLQILKGGPDRLLVARHELTGELLG